MGRLRMIARTLGLCLDVVIYIMQSMQLVDIDMWQAAFGGPRRTHGVLIASRAAEVRSLSLAQYSLEHGANQEALITHAVIYGAANIVTAYGYAARCDLCEGWIKQCLFADDGVTFRALMKHISGEVFWWDHLSTAISLNRINMFKNLLAYADRWHGHVDALIANNREEMIDYAFRHIGGEIYKSQIVRAIELGNKTLVDVILKHCARGQKCTEPSINVESYYPVKVSIVQVEAYWIPPTSKASFERTNMMRDPEVDIFDMQRDPKAIRAAQIITTAQKQVAHGRNPHKR